MDDYLQYDDPEDDFKFDINVYPNHIIPKLAYEVGLISSDGDDVLSDEGGHKQENEPLPSFDIGELENIYNPVSEE